MKKILLFTNAVTLGLLIWCWCFHRCIHTQPKPMGIDTSTHRIKEACETCVQTADSGPFDFDGDFAVKMVTNYTADHWMAINNANSGNIKDSRSVWLSISRIKGFINAIEDSAINKLPGCCCDLGIRIYFAEYDSALIDTFQRQTNGTFNPNNEHYAGKTTVLLIPTYKWTDGTQHDFNPIDPTIRCNMLQPESTWHHPIMALAMNHGGVIPPPFPSKFAPAYMNSGADFMIHGVDIEPTNSNSSPNPYFYYSVPTTPGEPD